MPILDRNRHRRQGRKCLWKLLITSFVWLNHQLLSLLTQTMSATSGSYIDNVYRRRRARARANNKQLSKKCGRTVAQLGEQWAQPIPPLVVPPTTRDSTRAQYYCGQTVYVP